MNALREMGRHDRIPDSISQGDSAAVCPEVRLTRVIGRDSSAAALEKAAGQKLRRAKMSKTAT